MSGFGSPLGSENLGGSGSVAPSSFFQNPANTDWNYAFSDFVDNFTMSSGANYSIGPLQFIANLSAGTSFQANSEITNAEFGIRVFELSSSAAAFYTWATDVESLILGGGTYRIGVRVKFEDIPDGTENYNYFIGYSTNTNALPSTNYAVFGINRGDSTTKFVLKVKDATTEQLVTTTVDYASDTWFNLEIEIGPSQVVAYIDGVLVGTVTENIPNATTGGLCLFMSQRLGTPSTTRNVYYDFAYVAWKMTADRGAFNETGPFGA